MNTRHVILLLLCAAFPAIWLFPPWEEEERVYHVNHGSDPLLDTNSNPADVPAIRTRPAGYAWRFTGPQRNVSEFGYETTYRVDCGRLALVLALATVGLCLAAIVLSRESVFLESAPAPTTNWRGHLAARVPALMAGSYVLAWFIPIQAFLVCTLDAGSWFPVLGLSAIGFVLGNHLPAACLRIRAGFMRCSAYGTSGISYRKVIWPCV